MSGRPTRRALLAALGTAGGVGLAGCASFRGDSEDAFAAAGECSPYDPVEPSRTTWPTRYGGGAGTSTVAADAAPDGDLSLDWQFPFETHIGYHVPIVDGDTVYVHDLDETLFALAVDTGEEHWRVDLPRPRPAPAVAGDRLIVETDDGIECLDAATGANEWTTSVPLDGIFACQPFVVDGTVYATDGVGISAFALADGSRRWRVPVGLETRSRPAVVDGTLYAGSDDAYVRALATEDGTERWRYKTTARVESNACVVRGTVYVGTDDGTVIALGAADGEERWRYRLSSGEPTEVSSVASDGSRVYATTGKGLYALDAATGTPCWRTGAYSTNYAGGLAVASGRLYAPVRGRGPDRAAVFDAATGDRQKTFAGGEGQRFAAGPSVADGALYVAGRSGVLRFS